MNAFLRRSAWCASAVLLFVGATARSASAQNVLTNPHFDTSLTGWTTAGTVTFDAANDANSSASSGSARVVVTALPVNSGTSAGPGQCHNGITALASYDFGGKVLLSAAPTNGRAWVIVSFYSDTTCATFLSASAGNNVTSIGVWLPSTGTVVAPAGTQSALIQTNEGTDASNPGDFLVNYDDMFLQLSSAVPAMPPALVVTLLLALVAGAVWMARRNRALA